MRALFIFFTFYLPLNLFAQSILVNPVAQPESALGAEDLTREVLISGGACSDISNFQLKDNPSAQFPNANRSWGYFEKGNSAFPFEKGIVLTSGSAKRSEGPKTGTASDGSYDWTGDADATALAGGSTNNATVFEFDFVPFGDEISFNYIFASEEYPTFSCSSYNDVFGFVISGPGITNDPGLSGKNIALLPNGLPVTINNVNDKECGDATYYVPGSFPYIQYGGRTTVLTAQSQVIPGESYHIRLIIADRQDTIYDSAVFLEAGSFNLGSTIIDLSGIEVEDGSVLCDVPSYNLIVNVAAPNATFQWSFNGIEIPGATQDNYVATETGNYSVVIFATGCSTEASVDLVFSNSPDATPFEVSECSEDGSFTFNLTDYNLEISTSPDVEYSYYNTLAGAQDEDPADLILNFQNFEINQNTVVFVRVDNESGCHKIVSLTLEIGVGPETQAVIYSECEINGSGETIFDLTSQENQLVVSNPAQWTFEYYLDANATQQIPNPTEFTNTSNPQVIYVKVFDPVIGDAACVSMEELTLNMDEFPEIQPFEISTCENLNTVNLTQNDIIVTQGSNATLKYFTAIGGTEITNPENYEVINNPTTVFVLVRNNSGTCEEYETITINLLDIPEVTDEIIPIEICSLTPFTTFHLPDANDELVPNTNGLTFSYHLTYDQAFNNTNQLPENYLNIEANQIVFVRIQNATNCFDVGRIKLDTVLVHEEIQTPFEVCDDPYLESNGTSIFDLTEMQSEVGNILGGNNYTLTYHTSLEDAVNGVNPIASPTNYTNTSNPQTIYVQASSGQGGCAGVVEFDIEVLAVPEFEMKNSIDFCNYDTVKTFEYLGEFASYTWYDANGNIISNSATVEFTEAGTHTLEVTTTESNCSARRDIEVNFDAGPTITQIVVDGSTVSVSASGGFAPYTYSYTNGLIWEDHYIMYDVPSGVHELLVKSKNGCISTAKMFGVLGIPNFISPNGDGINDVWTVRGLEAYPNAHVKIFDRYGKIFLDRTLNPNFQWDGTYQGHTVSSGDYWYIITIEDGKTLTGHISVRTN